MTEKSELNESQSIDRSIPFKIDDLNIIGTASFYWNSGSVRFVFPKVFHKLLGISRKNFSKYNASWNYIYDKKECINYVNKLYQDKTLFFIVIPQKIANRQI